MFKKKRRDDPEYKSPGKKKGMPGVPPSGEGELVLLKTIPDLTEAMPFDNKSLSMPSNVASIRKKRLSSRGQPPQEDGVYGTNTSNPPSQHASDTEQTSPTVSPSPSSSGNIPQGGLKGLFRKKRVKSHLVFTNSAGAPRETAVRQQAQTRPETPEMLRRVRSAEDISAVPGRATNPPPPPTSKSRPTSPSRPKTYSLRVQGRLVGVGDDGRLRNYTHRMRASSPFSQSMMAEIASSVRTHEQRMMEHTASALPDTRTDTTSGSTESASAALEASEGVGAVPMDLAPTLSDFGAPAPLKLPKRPAPVRRGSVGSFSSSKSLPHFAVPLSFRPPAKTGAAGTSPYSKFSLALPLEKVMAMKNMDQEVLMSPPLSPISPMVSGRGDPLSDSGKGSPFVTSSATLSSNNDSIPAGGPLPSPALSSSEWSKCAVRQFLASVPSAPLSSRNDALLSSMGKLCIGRRAMSPLASPIPSPKSHNFATIATSMPETNSGEGPVARRSSIVPMPAHLSVGRKGSRVDLTHSAGSSPSEERFLDHFCSPRVDLTTVGPGSKVRRSIIPAPDDTDCVTVTMEGGREIIKGAVPKALVNSLTDENVDTDHLDVFLFTYHYFMKKEVVFDYLCERYLFLPPPNCSADLKESYEKWRPPVRLRCVNLLKKWIDRHYYDFESDVGLTNRLLHFADTAIAADAQFQHWVPTLKKKLKDTHLLRRIHGGNIPSSTKDVVTELALHIYRTEFVADVQRKGKLVPRAFQAKDAVKYLIARLGVDSEAQCIATLNLLIPNQVYRVSAKKAADTPLENNAKFYAFKKSIYEQFDVEQWPKPIMPRENISCVLDCDPQEVARQLALVEFGTFKCITPREIIAQSWNKSEAEMKSPNVMEMINWFNKMSFWVASEILSVHNLRDRGKYLKWFIHLAEYCRKVQNLNAVMEIMVGLNLGPIQRLLKTWAQLSTKTKEVYKNLSDFTDPTGNHRMMRSTLRVVLPPMVPYVGMYLKDLTFIEDGNSTFTDKQEQVVNWDKMRMLAAKFSEMQQFQDTNFAFLRVEKLQDFITARVKRQETGKSKESVLYQMSQCLELRM